MPFLFKNYSPVEVIYLFIRCNRLGWGGEAKGVPAMGLDASEFFFFDSAKEATNEVTTFLNLRFIKKQKPALF